MFRKSIVVKEIIIVGCIIATISVLFQQPFAAPSSKPLEINPKVYYLQTQTDEKGHFKIDHNLPVETGTTGSNTIICGIIVSMKNGSNDGWYTINSNKKYDSRIVWSNKDVGGFIDNPMYANQPVRIMIFTTQLFD
ncbi:hypothetical protein JXA70_03635 [candidate division KSB1 bacterium]|nr:hypothetical protein [candidate division KSB1 bacterium]